MRERLTVFAVLLMLTGCATRATGPYRLLQTPPGYAVEAPDAERTAFQDVLTKYTAHGPWSRWVEMRPGVGLKIENTIFREGSTSNDLDDYLGTELARYLVRSSGDLVEFGAAEFFAERPSSQRGVDQLLPLQQRKRKHHRFFYQVLLTPTDTQHKAVLLSADSQKQLQLLTEQLSVDPISVCGVPSRDCTVFPALAAVALMVEVVIDGKPTMLTWGSRLSSLGDASRLELSRLYQGEWRKVEFDPSDRGILSAPLLPGDRVRHRANEPDGRSL